MWGKTEQQFSIWNKGLYFLFAILCISLPTHTHTYTHAQSIADFNVRPYGNTTAQQKATHTHKNTHTHTMYHPIGNESACMTFTWKVSHVKAVKYRRMCICPPTPRLCVRVLVCPCQGRSAVLALDSTCCYWRHWSQLATQCGCESVCDWDTDVVLLCLWWAPSLNVPACVFLLSPSVYYVKRVLPLVIIWCFSAASLTNTQTSTGHYKKLGASQSITGALWGPFSITNNINSLHSSWDTHTLTHTLPK